MAFSLVEVVLRQVLQLVLLACRSSRSKDLEILVLRQEISVLRRQVPHLRFRREDRLVLAVLAWLRPAGERVSLIVTPDTLRRWHRQLVSRKWRYRHRVTPRRGIPLEVQVLVWRMARDNPAWGYRRLQGELAKVGIAVSATSIRRILANPRRPRPDRQTWSQFMRAQAASIIACDLFTVETVTLKTLNVLFFIDLNTRRVLLGGISDRGANVAWCAQIARNLAEVREARTQPIRFLVHDRDKRFGAVFDEVFQAEDVKIVRTPWRAPRANAYAERWVRTVRTECLDRLMIVGVRHLHAVLGTYMDHYNRQRTHRGLQLQPPDGPWPTVAYDPALTRIERRDRLGGVIHEYQQAA
jgi:hypothetical protein